MHRCKYVSRCTTMDHDVDPTHIYSQKHMYVKVLIYKASYLDLVGSVPIYKRT